MASRDRIGLILVGVLLPTAVADGVPPGWKEGGLVKVATPSAAPDDLLPVWEDDAGLEQVDDWSPGWRRTRRVGGAALALGARSGTLEREPAGAIPGLAAPGLAAMVQAATRHHLAADDALASGERFPLGGRLPALVPRPDGHAAEAVTDPAGSLPWVAGQGGAPSPFSSDRAPWVGEAPAPVIVAEPPSLALVATGLLALLLLRRLRLSRSRAAPPGPRNPPPRSPTGPRR